MAWVRSSHLHMRTKARVSQHRGHCRSAFLSAAIRAFRLPANGIQESRSPPRFASHPSGAIRAQVLLCHEVLKRGDGSSIPLVGARDRRDHDVSLPVGPGAPCGNNQQQRSKKDDDGPPPWPPMR